MARSPALTTVALDALKSTGKLYEISDGHTAGLRIAVQPSGAKSWIVRYRPQGSRQNRKLTLGAYPKITLKEARGRAAKALGSIATGGDPAAERRAAREEKKRESAETVEAVVELFTKRVLQAEVKTDDGSKRPALRSWKETKRILDKNVVERWRERPFASLTRKEVHDLLDEVVDRGSPIMANRVLAALRRLCSWAVERDIIQASPCNGVKAKAAEISRDRVLSDDELARVWKACDVIGWPFAPIVRLLILTGARREEIGAMRWSELDLERKIWTLPKARAKNGAEHVVPLSAQALAIIKQLPVIEGEAGFVFTTSGVTAVSGFSRAKDRLDAVLKNAGGALPPWRFHDLRRSFASGCAALGIALPVVERMLNHVSGSFGGIRGVYQKFDFMPERRAAMDAWGRHIEAVTSGAKSNVVELAAARA